MNAYKQATTIINEGIRAEEVGACILCGAEGLPGYKGMRDRLFGSPGVWGSSRCPRCDLVWLNPRPVQNDRQKVYQNYFTHAVQDVKPIPASGLKKLNYYTIGRCYGYDRLLDGPVSRLMGIVAGGLPFRKEAVGRKVMWLDFVEGGTLLDVGCGHGKLLAKMRNFGWNVMGVEPDAEAANVARRNFDIEVVPGTLEEARFPGNSFDAVIMGHVIEHVHDPVGLLRECHRILKPRGRLVAVTPNAESMGHRRFGKDWFPLDPPRHLYLFSMTTLRACAESAGLRVQALKTSARTAPTIWASSRLIRENGGLPDGSLPHLNRSLRLGRKWFQLKENILHLFQKNAGEEVVMTATKEEV